MKKKLLFYYCCARFGEINLRNKVNRLKITNSWHTNTHKLLNETHSNTLNSRDNRGK